MIRSKKKQGYRKLVVAHTNLDVLIRCIAVDQGLVNFITV
jgi:hypothetical protein